MLNNPNRPGPVYPTIQTTYIIPARTLFSPNSFITSACQQTNTYSFFSVYTLFLGPCLDKQLWSPGTSNQPAQSWLPSREAERPLRTGLGTTSWRCWKPAWRRISSLRYGIRFMWMLVCMVTALLMLGRWILGVERHICMLPNMLLTGAMIRDWWIYNVLFLDRPFNGYLTEQSCESSLSWRTENQERYLTNINPSQSLNRVNAQLSSAHMVPGSHRRPMLPTARSPQFPDPSCQDADPDGAG